MPTPTGKLSAYLKYLLFQSQQLRCAFLSTWNFPQVNTTTLVIWQRFLCESDSLLAILISQTHYFSIPRSKNPHGFSDQTHPPKLGREWRSHPSAYWIDDQGLCTCALHISNIFESSSNRGEKKERTFIELLILLLVSQLSNEYGANLSLLACKPVPSKTKAQCGSIQFLLYDPIFLS